MPALVKHIERLYRTYVGERNAFRKIVIEAKSSGSGVLQTLQQGVVIPTNVLVGYNPKVDKQTRWSQAAVWCSLDMVKLPHPNSDMPWLHEAEEELFSLPNAEYFDQADSFSQLVLYLEHVLTEGYRAKTGK